MNNDSIDFTQEKAEAFRRAYAHAVETKQEQFTFEGHVILTTFAKYLLEFLALKGFLT